MPRQNYAMQLLADVEDTFQEPGDPRYLPTHHLLLLAAQPGRPPLERLA
jgi:hypothetical protein